jgi:catechol 2,3-dioxygenase-like lactoylglutathione lyase family enzyme
MGERNQHEHGTFSWTDLSTPDADASRDFYGALLGWDFDDAPIPEEAGGGFYRMAKIDGRSAAAMYESSERHLAWASAWRLTTWTRSPRAAASWAGREHRRRGRERAWRAVAEPAQLERP